MPFDALRGVHRACVSTRENQQNTRNTLLRANCPRLKPIPTKYDGYFFRSLTEARYAVLWNACYWPYEYERRGFALERGAYRPDFYFPNHGAWVEVKGPPPTLREEDLCQCLAMEARQPVAIAWDQPSWGTVIVLFTPDGERVLKTMAWFLRQWCLCKPLIKPSRQHRRLILTVARRRKFPSSQWFTHKTPARPC
jgi:hypothetical protein